MAVHFFEHILQVSQRPAGKVQCAVGLHLGLAGRQRAVPGQPEDVGFLMGAQRLRRALGRPQPMQYTVVMAHRIIDAVHIRRADEDVAGEQRVKLFLPFAAAPDHPPLLRASGVHALAAQLLRDFGFHPGHNLQGVHTHVPPSCALRSR